VRNRLPKFLDLAVRSAVELVQTRHEHHGKFQALAAVKRRELDVWRSRRSAAMSLRGEHANLMVSIAGPELGR